MRFLAVAAQGMLEDAATVSTISSYVDAFCSLLARGSEGRVVVDKDGRKELHEKHYASMEDVRKLVDAYHADVQHFRTNRMHVQMTALTLLLTFSTERIGAIVESNCYHGSNQGLTWGDIAVMATTSTGRPTAMNITETSSRHFHGAGRMVATSNPWAFTFTPRPTTA